MNREVFLIEAALRLITAKPGEKMSRIAAMANELTDIIFGEADDPERKSRGWWDYAVDTAPVHILIGYIEKQWSKGGFGVTLEGVFKVNEITTVGDLLLIGRSGFKKYRNIGRGCIKVIDEALEALYNINSW